jgi:TRIAP1/MDM35 family protein
MGVPRLPDKAFCSCGNCICIVDKMNSIHKDCQELKEKYDACFNEWFKEKFLKGAKEDVCAPIFKDYQACVKVGPFPITT